MVEYTLEDFEEVIRTPTSTTNHNDPIIVRRKAVFAYFAEHPEKLIVGGTCKKLGYTAEQVRDILIGKAANNLG